MNTCVFMGRFVRDPETRQASNGNAVCNFTLAVDRDFKDADGNRGTDFIDFVAFRRTAEFVSKYFSKGRMAAVEGRLQIESYTDKEGIKRRSAKILVDKIHFADSKRDSGDGFASGSETTPATPSDSASASNYSGQSYQALDYDDSDIPF